MKERDGHVPEFAGAKGSFRKEVLLEKVRKIEAETGKRLIPINPMAVCGRDHLLSAYLHTMDAFSEGRAVAKDFSAEFFRYLTGKRQVSVAIEKGGIAENGAVIILSEMPADRVISVLGLERDDDLIECSAEKTEYLGINGTGIKGEEMALELTAMVAVL